jgi:dolichol-phosphate mannosyltransferase
VYEILFVNDGSTDDTATQIRKAAEKNPRIKMIELSRNFGNQNAIGAGLLHAQGEAVITMDADLQHPPEIIELLIEKWEQGGEVILTRRLGYDNRWSRKLFFWFFSKLSDIEIDSSISDFRLLDRKVVNVLNRFTEKERFFRGMVHWVGFRREYVDYRPSTRRSGSSKFSNQKLWKLGLEGFTSFSTFPLRLSWILGVPIFFGSAFSLVFMAVTISFFNPDYFRPIAFVTVLNALLSGLILICLGCAAKYLELVYREAIGRPSYIIRDTLNVEETPILRHGHYSDRTV